MRKKKIKKKISVHVSIDIELLEKSNKYIENLSAYFNKCLFNAISSYEKKELKENTEKKELKENTENRIIEYQEDEIWWDDE